MSVNTDKKITLGQIIKDAIEQTGKELTEKIPAEENKSDSMTLMAEGLLNSILSQNSSYSYDVNADPLYRQYRDMYKKNASLAAGDVFGLASSLSGGYGNSYAATAAASAAENVYSGLAEKVSDLEKQAYERHSDSIKSRYDVLDAVKLIDGLKQNDREEAFDTAEFFAKYGDTSELEKLGVDISSLKKQELTDIAEVFAKYGDYSLLKALGMDTSGRETEDLYNRLLLQARYKKT